MMRAMVRPGQGLTALVGSLVIAANTKLNDSLTSSSARCDGCVNNRTSVNAPTTVQIRRIFTSNTKQQQNSLHNSMLLIPNVLSPVECTVLRQEADRLLDDDRAGGTYRRDRYSDEEDDDDEEEEDSSLRRLSVCDMSSLAQNISNRVIKERVLPALHEQMPHLCRELGLEGWNSSGSVFEWASDEPSVNRYTSGGRFEPHRDGYSLTVIILLSEKGAFEGGGTEFFDALVQEGATCDHDLVKKSVLVQPAQGAAVCFDGDIIHAGSSVISGTRHVFVASFGVV